MHTGLLAALLLLLAPSVQQGRAVGEQAGWQAAKADGAAGGGAPLPVGQAAAAAAAALPSDGPALRQQLTGPLLVSSQSQELFPGAAALFQHPTAPEEQGRSRAAAEAAHAELRHWLEAYLSSEDSAMSSLRLAAARAALAEQGSVNMTAPALPAGPLDMLAAAGVPQGGRCDAACARAAALSLLLEHERPGQGPAQLRWPPLTEDARRWAAGGGGRGVCKPRQPGETIHKDYLLIAPVGDDLTAVNRWVGGRACSQAGGAGCTSAVSPSRPGELSPAAAACPSPGRARCALRIAPACRWLSMPDSATFDVVLLHYGGLGAGGRAGGERMRKADAGRVPTRLRCSCA